MICRSPFYSELQKIILTIRYNCIYWGEGGDIYTGREYDAPNYKSALCRLKRRKILKKQKLKYTL